MKKVCVLILCSVFLATVSEGAAIAEGSSWLQGARLLLRARRDVEMGTGTMPEISGGGDESGSECSQEQVRTCLFDDARRTLGHNIMTFDLNDIYPNIDTLCAPKPECLQAGCGGVWVRAQMDDAMLNWICSNRDGFRQARQCFQHPFKYTMQTCLRGARGRSNTDVTTMITNLRNCVTSALDDLELCSATSKVFFLSLFDLALDLQIRGTRI